jgi:hypothetical protein
MKTKTKPVKTDPARSCISIRLIDPPIESDRTEKTVQVTITELAGWEFKSFSNPRLSLHESRKRLLWLTAVLEMKHGFTKLTKSVWAGRGITPDDIYFLYESLKQHNP